MAATLESVSDEIGQTFVNRQQPFARQSSTQLCSAKKDIVYVPSQNETIIPSRSIPSVHNLKSSSRMEDISCQGSLEAKINGMMPAAHHTEHLSPSTKPAQNLRDADPAYGLYDKHLPPKWTKLEALLSAFHINRKCRPNVGDRDISPGVPSQGFSDAESCSSALQANYPWRHKGRRRIQRLSYVLMVYVAGVLALMAVRVGNSHPWNQREDPVLELVEHQEGSQGFMPHDSGLRHKRDVRVEYITVAENSSSHHEAEHLNCTPRSVSNFPKNFLNFHDTQNGGFILNILIAMYMFAALAIVCDDYFVPALEHICEDLGLQADVAGATFMAAGSSAPEFMTSVVGVFFAQSDVGVGTIVGSAVFNILFIIGICGVFAGMVVELTWYPLVRDTLYYLISVLTLVLIIKDQQVMWYEATIMVILYMLYIVLMYFNRFLESSSIAWVQRLAARLERQPLVAKPPETHIIPEEMKRARAHSAISKSHSVEKRVEWVPMTKNGYTRFEDEPESHSRYHPFKSTVGLVFFSVFFNSVHAS
ncbi:hypothetical protein EGW08_022979 [Elysia chlorotica]|uniref:Sodium/calcium exchanger membrane region domain-containing protein n=1 Tax=Elysia chlorotica TaxID=188477 RepID=A0A3S0ZK45_ELYCH|nr:hypothetical protein EGW08_022979 [Elysia chlorotica]